MHCTDAVAWRGSSVIEDKASQKVWRWVVGHTHVGLNRFWRIYVRWDTKPAHSLAFLSFAYALIAFRAAGLWLCGEVL
jgi:hypothetical protein